MADKTGSSNWVRKVARAVLITGIALLAVQTAWTVIQQAMAWQAAGDAPWQSQVALGVSIVGLVFAGLVMVLAYGVVLLLASGHEALADNNDRSGRVETLLASHVETAKRQAEYGMLSDRARSLIYREHELEALRETVHHELMQQDYAGALALIETVEKDFGYAEEASRLRQQVENARRSTLDEKVDVAVRRVQDAIDRLDWTRGLREAQRAARVFPNDAKVAMLVDRVTAARSQHKSELLKRYGEAVKKNDVDGGIELLRQLDAYLTPQEAAALQESARGVFRAKLHNLGVQFSISITEQRWADAIATGEQIVAEYPNSRMAHEVREKLDVLRLRAEQPKAAKGA
ncbi:MAG: hypothetical protein NTV86_09575 [Planctomycetota bacterium]|nr:hypothetical protein [Planctomycetota bacterium]